MASMGHFTIWRICAIAVVWTGAAFATSDSGPIAAKDSVRYAKLIQDARGTADSKKQIELLAEATKVFAEDGDVWLRYGQSLLREKQFDQAEAAYRQVLRLGAFQAKAAANAQYDLACLYALKGDKKSAVKWLRDSLASGFRDLNHLRTDSDLDALHELPEWVEIAATKDVSKMSRDEGWRYDLWLMDREARRIHFDPYRKTPKNELDRFVADLNRNIPKMSDEAISTAFIRYMAMYGDGHTGVRMAEGPMRHVAPVLMAQFAEGTFVIATDRANANLLGHRLDAIEGQPVQAIWDKMAPIIRRDNDMTLASNIPSLMGRTALLYGLGLSKSPDKATYTFAGPDGKKSTVTLTRGPQPKDIAHVYDSATNPVPMYKRNPDKPYWFEYLPESKVMYLQYNAVRNDPQEPLAAFADRFYKAVDENDVRALVIDARFNGGGNSFLNRPLVHGIIKRDKINKQGSLFVIIGRETFSAAQNFVTDIDRECNPIFVGEPSGSSPNFVGETIQFSLPYSKMSGSISDLYWQRSWPMDERSWIPPDLPAPPTFEAYSQNRDVAMEAILEYLKSD
ncbi:MAG: hypothetical protein HONBIEJF_00988 [Fimbriimonadaceae bacterium]|nr:hypothetical protein [Fimbriimonadaceae bacterium]